MSQIEKSSSIVSKHDAQRANTFVLWGFIIMFVGAAFGVIGKMVIHDATVTAGGVLIALAGMFLTVYPFLLPSTRKRSDLSAEPEKLAQSQPKALHKSEVDYLPSITERTTDLLEHSVATPKQKDSGTLQT